MMLSDLHEQELNIYLKGYLSGAGHQQASSKVANNYSAESRLFSGARECETYEEAIKSIEKSAWIFINDHFNIIVLDTDIIIHRLYKTDSRYNVIVDIEYAKRRK